MKILILGAQGNLGTQLVKTFRGDSGYRVTAWDMKEIDITNESEVSDKVGALKPDIIINAAAYNAVDKCEEDDREYKLARRLNGNAVGYIAQVALDTGAVAVHYSTDYVFRGDKRGGYREDDQPDPINRYGETKLTGEREIIQAAEQGVKWYLIRTSKLFGPQGVNPAAKPSFFDLMLQLSWEKDNLDVVNEEVSCFTYTPDLARATRKLLESSQEHGIYHLVNSGPVTWYEAAAELFGMADIKIKVNPVPGNAFPRPAKRPQYSVLLNTKFDQMRDWREALREYLTL